MIHEHYVLTLHTCTRSGAAWLLASPRHHIITMKHALGKMSGVRPLYINKVGLICQLVSYWLTIRAEICMVFGQDIAMIKHDIRCPTIIMYKNSGWWFHGGGGWGVGGGGGRWWWWSPVTSEYSSRSPMTHSSDAFYDLCQKKRLSEQSRHRWFETPSRSLWRHCNGSSTRMLANSTPGCRYQGENALKLQRWISLQKSAW